MIDEQGLRLGEEAAHRLARLGWCEIEPGLSDAEFARIEGEYGFEFADDHRAFLAAGLPVSHPPEEGQTWDKPWPEWRNGDPDRLREHLDWPIDYLLSDVRRGHWRHDWGERPGVPEEAVESARRKLAQVPRMVPVYAHRFLPAGRGSFGHPVLSMRGSDTIYYGADLVDYIGQEFEPETSHLDRMVERQPRATVPFWRDYLSNVADPS
ncbi:hypothetical protein AB0L00_36640 [Actinoallomurus sp. NPDC052308]|uniref:hypothetical protein n=1 Tax=Actinoallomurus sp. NPDC052308 TaxID=3155530 RepID=UPI00341B0491